MNGFGKGEKISYFKCVTEMGERMKRVLRNSQTVSANSESGHTDGRILETLESSFVTCTY